MASGEIDPNRQKIVEGRVRWSRSPRADHQLPDGPMDPIDAHLLIEQELLLDGDPVHPSERKRVHTGTGY